MKLAGKNGLIKNTKIVTMKSADGDLTLKVNPLPLGWFDRMMRIGAVTAGDPPIVVVEEKGKIKRDENGHAVVRVNDLDPAYISRKAECGARLMALKVYFHLKDGNDIDVGIPEPISETESEWVDFGNHLVSVFADFGFTDTEMVEIGRVGDLASTRIDAEEIAKSFL